MAQVYRIARSRRTQSRSIPQEPRSNLTVSFKSGLPSSSAAHLRSTSQSMRAPGNESRSEAIADLVHTLPAIESRSEAIAGRVCTRSPREPNRTIRNRSSDFSGIGRLTQAREEFARGVLLRVADDGDAHA